MSDDQYQDSYDAICRNICASFEDASRIWGAVKKGGVERDDPRKALARTVIKFAGTCGCGPTRRSKSRTQSSSAAE